MVAASVADLHSANNKLNKENSLSEKGEVINGRGDTPNRHDILTGSQADGTAFPAGDDRTCGNWSSSTTGAAMVGHHDRQGLNDRAAGAVVEFVASLARSGRRLRAERPARHRRRRVVLLLCRELSTPWTVLKISARTINGRAESPAVWLKGELRFGLWTRSK